MPGGLGRKLYLFAFLLSVSQADISSDLNEGEADSRSGDIFDLFNFDSEEARDETVDERKFDHAVPISEDKSPGSLLDIIKQENERISPESPPYDPLIHDNDGSDLKDDFLLPNDPHEGQFAIMDYPLEISKPKHYVVEGLASRLIPQNEQVLLTNKPGAPQVLTCSREGEFYHAWAPGLKCMVCACVNYGGKIRPVCTSCSACLPEPEPPTPPKPDKTISCRPLPIDVPFQSPMDPCKICICTERTDLWGKKDVQIKCLHNPQCVMPPTTETPDPTPIPPRPVCDKFPENVPFPHPQDPCQTCKCTVILSITTGMPEQYISCEIIPECQPPRPEPTTIAPPEPEICDQYPLDRYFQHPRDPCQTCKCTVSPYTSLFIIKKRIICYVVANCLPSSTPEPEPSTINPIPSTTQPDNVSVCGKYSENEYFPHPGDVCQLCKCTVHVGNFGVPIPHINCFTKPDCVLTTPIPEPSTTEPTPLPPQPENVKCAPFPVDVPFQNPMNPCLICVCTERADVFGHIDVQIECHENPQCVLPPNVSTLPPIVTPMPLPACGQFPENVYFPHPDDVCQVCKCSVLTNVHGVPEPHINCFTKPECRITTPQPPFTTPEPEVTTLPPPPTEICERYPVDIYFQHPKDRCQFCKCTINPNIFINKKKIICHVAPDCLEPSTPIPRPSTTAPSTLPPQPENVKCAPLPVDVPFQNPMNPCQICICTERADVFGRIDVEIDCQENPQCVLPPDSSSLPPVVTPVPLPACGQFPENVYFPHPDDVCQVCKCSVLTNIHGVPEPHINCFIKPECSTTTEPNYTTFEPPFTTPEPEPTTLPPPQTEICERYPVEVYFQHPKDRCQFCKCSVNPNMFINKKMIICHVVPDCLTPSTLIPMPSTSTPGTLPPQPENVKCAPLPVDVPFQNPMNPCQICVCTERADVFGHIDVQIECQENPQCVLPPDSTTLPPIVTPIPLPVCDQFPENVYFPHPDDHCQVCKCSVLVNVNGIPEPHINCFTKPECSFTEEPSTFSPVPSTTIAETTPVLEIVTCAPLPSGKPFQNPLNPCQICVCKERVDLFGRHDVHIECEENPDCIVPPDGPTLPPIIIKPIDFPSCNAFPENVPFPHPTDPCLSCKCTHEITPTGYNKPLISCTIIPECQPTSQPITGPTPQPTPEPTSAEPPQPHPKDICVHHPKNVPFTHPSDPCQLCICYGEISGHIPGESMTIVSADMLYKCFLKPNCYSPTSAPLTQKPPTPDPQHDTASCNPLPKDTPFQNPMDPCQICICTETQDMFGRPDVIIKCQENPQCVMPTTSQPVTISPSSEAPEPSLCEGRPQNILFPDPEDHCRLCRCTIETNIFGGTEMTVNCIVNPSCSTTPAPSTPSPWPPTPPGPLPGPFPHESCKPYAPNKPFQHPWDDCQVCLCREHVSMERITIEVNCYTKPSCCIEPPFDAPGTGGGSSTGPIVIGHGTGKGTNVGYRPTVDFGRNHYLPSHENVILPIEGNLIGYSDEGLIKPADDNAVISTGDYVLGSYGNNQIGHTVTKLNDPTQNWNGEIRSEKWHPQGVQYIDVEENENSFQAGNKPSDANLVRPSGVWNWPPNGQLINSHNTYANGKLIRPDNIKLNSPSNGELINSKYNQIDENLFGPGGIKWIWPSSGESIHHPKNELSVDSIASNVNKVPDEGLISGPDGNLARPFSNMWIADGGELIRPLDPRAVKSNRPNSVENAHSSVIITPRLGTGNLYVPSYRLQRKPINQPIVNGQWRVPNHVMPEQINLYHSHRPINMHPSLISKDQLHGQISPEIGYREGEASVHRHDDVMAPVNPGAPEPNGEPKYLVVPHPKPRLQMRTKSGKPTYDDAKEYDD